MATLDTSYVRRELRAIRDSSRAVSNLLKQVLEDLEADPSRFEPLQAVPPAIAESYPAVTLRKAKIESGRHSYRLVVAHWKLEDREDHVDVLYAFPRRRGYPIDWHEVERMLGGCPASERLSHAGRGVRAQPVVAPSETVYIVHRLHRRTHAFTH